MMHPTTKNVVRNNSTIVEYLYICALQLPTVSFIKTISTNQCANLLEAVSVLTLIVYPYGGYTIYGIDIS